MADRIDMRMSNNADFLASFTVMKNGVARDLTGATFEMDIRVTADASAEAATLTSGNGRVALSATPIDGRVFIKIPKAVAAILVPGTYVHDMLMTIAGAGQPERIWYGSLHVTEGVSR